MYNSITKMLSDEYEKLLKTGHTEKITESHKTAHLFEDFMKYAYELNLSEWVSRDEDGKKYREMRSLVKQARMKNVRGLHGLEELINDMEEPVENGMNATTVERFRSYLFERNQTLAALNEYDLWELLDEMILKTTDHPEKLVKQLKMKKLFSSK